MWVHKTVLFAFFIPWLAASCKARNFDQAVVYDWSTSKAKEQVKKACLEGLSVGWGGTYSWLPEQQKDNSIMPECDNAANKAGDKPPGGKTWTVQDELNFSTWMQEVDADIFLKWDFPTDCADAVIGLKLIYAYLNGLAFKMGDLNSLKFHKGPIEINRGFHSKSFIALFKKASELVNTKNLNSHSYEVNMWNPKLYQFQLGGVFLLYRSETHGHTVPIRYDSDKKLFFTLSSTTPSMLRGLQEEPFYHLRDKENYLENFRRLYAFRNNITDYLKNLPDNTKTSKLNEILSDTNLVKKVIENHDKVSFESFEAWQASSPSSQNKIWPIGMKRKTNVSPPHFIERCGFEDEENPLSDSAPLWISLLRYKNAIDLHKSLPENETIYKLSEIEKDKIDCPHNLAGLNYSSDTGKSYLKDPAGLGPANLEWDALLKGLQKSWCSLLNARANLVNLGYEQCNAFEISLQLKDLSTARKDKKIIELIKKCESGPEGDWSTPSLDVKMISMAQTVFLLSRSSRVIPYFQKKQIDIGQFIYENGQCSFESNVHENGVVKKTSRTVNMSKSPDPVSHDFGLSPWLQIFGQDVFYAFQNFISKRSDADDLRIRLKKTPPQILPTEVDYNRVSDPKFSIPERWGCPPEDIHLKCLTY